VPSAKKDAVAHVPRALWAIFHCNAWPIPHQWPWPSPPRPPVACCSPHRAANRLVQKTFRIGLPMRKVLSVSSFSKVFPIFRKFCRVISAIAEFSLASPPAARVGRQRLRLLMIGSRFKGLKHRERNALGAGRGRLRAISQFPDHQGWWSGSKAMGREPWGDSPVANSVRFHGVYGVRQF
jgi:hypothetical protein